VAAEQDRVICVLSSSLPLSGNGFDGLLLLEILLYLALSCLFNYTCILCTYVCMHIFCWCM